MLKRFTYPPTPADQFGRKKKQSDSPPRTKLYRTKRPCLATYLPSRPCPALPSAEARRARTSDPQVLPGDEKNRTVYEYPSMIRPCFHGTQRSAAISISPILWAQWHICHHRHCVPVAQARGLPIIGQTPRSNAPTPESQRQPRKSFNSGNASQECGKKPRPKNNAPRHRTGRRAGSLHG